MSEYVLGPHDASLVKHSHNNDDILKNEFTQK